VIRSRKPNQNPTQPVRLSKLKPGSRETAPHLLHQAPPVRNPPSLPTNPSVPLHSTVISVQYRASILREEHQSTITPLRYEPGTVQLLKPSSRCKQEARRATHSLVGVARPLNRVSAHRTLGPQVRWIASKKNCLREGERGDRRDGVIAQTSCYLIPFTRILR
jgi:hypothetical protein